MARTQPQSAEESDPKTTRPDTTSRRDPEPAISTEQKLDRRLDAFPDRVDVRDWFYQPSLSPLPDRLVNCHLVPEVLDQGREGACTGYALAAVINFLLKDRGLNHKVSPRMLYEMARRYDEWPGEEYEGSSARGTMKGWAKHGACSEGLWPASLHGPGNFTQEREDDARATPGGAFYRVMHRQVRDMHSALNEVGILYATLMVHAGWDRPGPQNVEISYFYKGNYSEITLPVIRREGPADRGHAIAIVGYTHQGFIIQNSWGPGWGKGGFALLPYEDYMLHATDVWVAQLGVPVDISLWVDEQGGERLGGLQRATRAIPLSEIRPYVVDIGDDGKLSMSGEYWTTEEDLERLFTRTIPEQTKDWSRRRVMLYLHGGLNDEATAARRIVAFRDVCKANEIYPLHIMWETGAMETLKQIIGEWLDLDRRAGGVGDWLEKVREGAIEAKDRTLELTAALPGTALWNKMKENARAASNRIDGIGGMQLIVKHVRAALDGLDPADRRSWDLHVVGHSAGTIFAAHALHLMQGLGITFKTLQFMAPAITVEGFKELVLPAIAGGGCPIPSTYVLSDVGERDDDVGPYGKSLLYLVSNAFEGRREEPILGMHRFISSDSVQRGEQDRVDPAMDEFFRGKVDGLPALVVSGRDQGDGCRSRSDSHGGFDNDSDTLNSILFRILGGKPKVEFVTRDFQF